MSQRLRWKKKHQLDIHAEIGVKRGTESHEKQVADFLSQASQRKSQKPISNAKSDLDKVYYTWPKPLDKRTPGTPNYYVSEKRPDWW